ncbi:hypothetical protein BDZ89DRAFT_1069006 [Hymenopellis radicata]|nr:hypothetical protein BDZ89DRAFT_1069006 [Hymenopellis radicata]
MCCLRQVRNVYTQCGHGVTLPDEMINCENSKCRWSPFHPLTCKPPSCLRTCRQNKTFPEQYNPHINALCPACVARQQQQQ